MKTAEQTEIGMKPTHQFLIHHAQFYVPVHLRHTGRVLPKSEEEDLQDLSAELGVPAPSPSEEDVYVVAFDGMHVHLHVNDKGLIVNHNVFALGSSKERL